MLLTQQALEARLWGAANALRGPIDPADFKNYVFPMLFRKWISDTFAYEHAEALSEYDDELTDEIEADYRRFEMPQGTRWSEVTTKVQNLGAEIAKAFQRIEKANPRSFAGVFGDAAWGNEERIPESALLGLIKAFDETTTPEYASLAQRIETLRTATIHNVEESLAFLERALGVAQDLVASEKSMTKTSVVDIRWGALTQIVEENTPSGLHKIVPDIVERIDAIVVNVVYSGWSESDAGGKKVRRELRKVLKDFSLAGDKDLFDKTYGYVRENY